MVARTKVAPRVHRVFARSIVPAHAFGHIAKAAKIHNRVNTNTRARAMIREEQHTVRNRSNRRSLSTTRQVGLPQIEHNWRLRCMHQRPRLKQLPRHRRLVKHGLPMHTNQVRRLTRQQLLHHACMQQRKLPRKRRDLPRRHGHLLCHITQLLFDRAQFITHPVHESAPHLQAFPADLKHCRINAIKARACHAPHHATNSLRRPTHLASNIFLIVAKCLQLSSSPPDLDLASHSRRWFASNTSSQSRSTSNVTDSSPSPVAET